MAEAARTGHGVLPALYRRLAPASVLCFHGVTSAEWPSGSPVNVPATAFAALADAVCSAAEVVPLAELVTRHRAGRPTRGLVAITFDDAYASLHTLLADVIASRRLPVTLFVATAYSATGRTFWWDRIDDLHSIVPAPRWRAFEDAVGLPEAYRTGQPAAFGPLRPLRQWLLRNDRGRTSTRVDDALRQLESELGRATVQRPMTLDELAQFCRRTGATVGVHTVTHPVLPLLDPGECRAEIVDCHRTLQERFGAAVVPVLAAPFGLYDAQVLATAEAAGMQATLTLANRTLATTGDGTGMPRLSMTVQSTPRRVLALASGLRERLGVALGRPWHPPPPALPSATS